jgi:pyridoxal phosphate enzyme (YggS family)
LAVTRNKIEKNLRLIRRNIDDAARRVGRDPAEISIVAVTKSVDVDTIKNLLDAGLLDLGENRTAQLTQRVADIQAYIQRRRNPLAGPVKWHMIGHLQRNKVKPIITCGATIHSVDSLRLAEAISQRARKAKLTVEIMLQVNCSQEQQKQGIAVGAATHLAEMIASMPNIRLVGLMTMAPMVADPQDARNSFARLRFIFDEIKKAQIGGRDFRHLSMGMSNDYTVAVEEGATILRIGSALFA